MKNILIGNEQRPVRYSINALIEFEDLTGIDISQGRDPGAFAKLKNMRALVYCGLKHGYQEKEEKDFPHSIEKVGTWIGFGDGSTDKFFDAFINDSSADKTEGEEPREDSKK